MEHKNFSTIILKASDGYFITQSKEVETKDRVVAKTIALGKYDSADNWKEITTEEADIIIKEQNEIRITLEKEKRAKLEEIKEKE